MHDIVISEIFVIKLESEKYMVSYTTLRFFAKKRCEEAKIVRIIYCPWYVAQRSRMLAKLKDTSSMYWRKPFQLPYIDIFPKYVTSALLFGSPDVDSNTNEEILGSKLQLTS